MEKENFFTMLKGGIRFSQAEVREIWFLGIASGIEIGLNKASLDGQMVELNDNTKDIRHKQFLEKFYKLAEEYMCAIQYHPEVGMTVVDVKRPYGISQ